MKFLVSILALMVSLLAIPIHAYEPKDEEPLRWMLAKGQFDQAPTAPQISKFCSQIPKGSRFLAVTAEHEVWVIAKAEPVKLQQAIGLLGDTKWTYIGAVEGVTCAQSGGMTDHVELVPLGEKLKVADNANAIVTAAANGLIIVGSPEFIRAVGKRGRGN
jgi:hypothetical protein